MNNKDILVLGIAAIGISACVTGLVAIPLTVIASRNRDLDKARKNFYIVVGSLAVAGGSMLAVKHLGK